MVGDEEVGKNREQGVDLEGQSYSLVKMEEGQLALQLGWGER